MVDDQEGAYYIRAIRPADGTETDLIVKPARIEDLKRQGIGICRDLEIIVPQITRDPSAIFQGVRDTGERKWLCYAGIPNRAHDRKTGQKIPPWPGMIYLVFVTNRSVVYNFRWEPADPVNPLLPEGHACRFNKRLR